MIFTGQTEITPCIEQRLRDDQDIHALARNAGALESHGALAGNYGLLMFTEVG